jgi:LytS/YehU family sensor histidine kinase
MKYASRFVASTAILTAVAVALSALSVPFVFGVRIHFFQVAIMLAGVIGGPLSGLVAGSVAGLYTAALMSNPTIILGNALLGLFTGILVRKMRPVLAGILAWVLIQAPWLYLSETYILNVPGSVMQTILITLTVEDIICAVITDVLQNRFHLREMVFPKLTSAQDQTYTKYPMTSVVDPRGENLSFV